MVGEADEILLEGIVWDDDIDAHFARHSVTFDDVMSVLSSEP